MEWWLIFFFGIALLYAMIGHGGASGYLATMSLLDMSLKSIRPTALALNLIVSLISFISFARAGHFRFNTFWPFALGSVPMAYLGGSLGLNDLPFKIMLGLFLLFASARMMGLLRMSRIKQRKFNVFIALGIGAVLGLFSGLIGIGGGIILSPIILLLGWADVKTTAATSALFIFVNSAAGLWGMAQGWPEFHSALFSMTGAVLIGGLVGGYLGSSRFSSARVQWVLSVVLLVAAVKLLLQV